MRHIRFSLSSLLVFVAAVALFLFCFILARRLDQSQSELGQLKVKYGELDVTDPDLIHVLEAPFFEPDKFRWRWQVYVPPTKKCRVRIAVGQIPVGGVTQKTDNARGASVDISGNADSEPVLVTVAFSRSSVGGLSLTLVSGREQATISLPEDSLPEGGMEWLFNNSGGPKILAGRRETQSQSANQPLKLLVHRKGVAFGKKSSMNPNPAAGIAVWIEEVTNP